MDAWIRTAARRGLQLGLAGALMVLLAACGGGGGGGSPQGDALRLTNIQATGNVQRAFEGPQALGGVVITADVSGDLAALNGQTVYVIVEDSDALFEAAPRVSISSNGIGNMIELFGRPLTGRTGSYRNPLRLNVCLDAACQRPFAGSPYLVSMQVDVLPGLSFAGATPRVIDLPFGAPVTQVSLPVNLPAEVNFWDFTLTPPAGIPWSTMTARKADNTTLELQVERLPVGRYTHSLQVRATAVLDGGSYALGGTLPIEVNILASGQQAAWSPGSAALRVTTSPIANSVDTFNAFLIAADGRIYSELSRVEYLPAGPSGNLDAGSIQWLSLGTGGNSAAFGAQTLVGGTTNGCHAPTVISPCLPPGRYDARLWMKDLAGLEQPVPLPVTLTVAAP